MTNAEYILKKYGQNPEFRFWDIKTASGKMVESQDNESVSHPESLEQLKEALENLEGIYTVVFKLKSKKETGTGGNIRPAAEYPVKLGNGQTSQGIGFIGQNNNNQTFNYLDRYIQESQARANDKIAHLLETMALKETIKELKSKKEGVSGISSNMENLLVAIATKELGITLPSAPVNTSINGLPRSETEAESRLMAAISKMHQLNPEGKVITMLENLAILMERFPEKIEALNKSLENVAAGQELFVSFMPLAQ